MRIASFVLPFSLLLDILGNPTIMFAQVCTPLTLLPVQLDEYLSRGWFRMGQNIFTTNFLSFKSHFYSAVWLRVVLDEYTPDNTELKLRKLNGRFTLQVGKASITPEKEELFGRYRENISFEASASLHQLLQGKVSHNVYDTLEVTLYDDEKLIACGFFDLGMMSAAGITSFYDPAYRKHSLGKYLIYLKMNFCRDAGLRYFYPGYFVPGYPFFDYKLSIGKAALEYLDFCSGNWLPIRHFSNLLTPIRLMQDKLSHLQIMLAKAKIECELFRYEFFEANLLPELKDAELFDYPLFLHYPGAVAVPEVNVIVYNIREQQYHLIRCRSVWNSNLPNANNMYSSELLKEEIYVHTANTAEDMVAAVATDVKRGIDVW